MSAENDRAHYVKRERQARELAAAAQDPHIRAVHLDMAAHYTKLLEDGKFARSAR